MIDRDEDTRLLHAISELYGRQPAPDLAARAAAWSAIERRAARPVARPVPHRRRRWPLVGGAVAGVALAAAAIGVVLPHDTAPVVRSADPAARAVLARAAVAVADERPLRAGEYRYLRTTDHWRVPGERDTHSGERWMGRDGSGRSVEEGKPDVLFPPTRSGSLSPHQEWAGFTAAQLQTMPTDADGMRRVLEDEATGEDMEPGGANPLGAAVAIINSPAPPAVRAAAYRALAALPGIRVRGKVTISGVRGVELESRGKGVAETLVIAPRRGILLADRVIVVGARRASKAYGHHLEVGFVVSDSIYETAIVGSNRDRPSQAAGAI